jgi:hypothetical protein
VAEGPVRAVKASADGAWLAILDGCSEARGQYLPPRTASCELRVVPAAGGAPRRVAGAVTTLPHAVVWAPEGDLLAALAEYDYLAGAGALVVARGGGEPTRIADGVTFHAFTPGGSGVVLISDGRLLAATPGSAPERLADAEGLASFELGPGASSGAPVLALARRSSRVGGELLAVASGSPAAGRGSAAAAVRSLAPRVGDYAFAPGGRAYAFTAQTVGGYELRLAAGDGPPRAIARQVHSFAFSRDGAAIAFVAEAVPGKQGNLHVAALGKRDTTLARDVGEHRWASRAPRLAWLEGYDPRVRSGTLGAGGPGLPARTLGKNVSDFELSPDGAHVAFLQHTTRGGYSVDLALAHVDGARVPPQTVAHGVFGFAFSGDGRWLYYRTRCTRNAEACDLERVPAVGLAPGATPEAIAPGVKSFEFDPRDPDRLLVTWQRMDLAALDVAVWEKGKLTSIDTAVLPGSAQFLGPDSRRVVYFVVQP